MLRSDPRRTSHLSMHRHKTPLRGVKAIPHPKPDDPKPNPEKPAPADPEPPESKPEPGPNSRFDVVERQFRAEKISGNWKRWILETSNPWATPPWRPLAAEVVHARARSGDAIEAIARQFFDKELRDLQEMLRKRRQAAELESDPIDYQFKKYMRCSSATFSGKLARNSWSTSVYMSRRRATRTRAHGSSGRTGLLTNGSKRRKRNRSSKRGKRDRKRRKRKPNARQKSRRISDRRKYRRSRNSNKKRQRKALGVAERRNH